MRRCVVPGCHSSRPERALKDRTNTPVSSKISLHSFPRDNFVRKKWLKFLNQPATIDTSKMFICSLHFDKAYFQHGIEIGIWRPKLYLNAIPSVKVPDEKEPTERSKRANLIRLKKELSLMVEKHPPLNESSVLSSTLSSNVESFMTGSAMEISEVSNDSADVMKCEIEALRTQLNMKNKQLEQCHEELSCYEKRTKKLEKLNEELQTVFQHQVVQGARKILAKRYTNNQIDVMLDIKKRPKEWTAEELSMGYALKYMSKPALDFTIDKLHLPLPSAKCLMNHASKINMRKGFFHEVLQLLSAWGATKTEMERVCIILYDEVSVSKAYEYDRANDDVLQPSSKMQVIMMRGLFGKWKQPIYADFDVSATMELLDEAISHAWNAGFECVGLVSDCGGGNQNIWSHINLDEELTFLLHPVTGGKVFLIADPPHTLKLDRNWLFDTGFHLEDGTFIPPVVGDDTKSNPLWQLVVKENTEISDTFFLTEHMLTVEGSQRQNVSMAAKIFSRKCGTALLRKVGTPIAKKLAEFIFTVNDYFDVFNSRNLNNPIDMKKPYGTNLAIQNAALDKMYNLMKTSIPGGKKKIQVFQRAIMMSIISLKALFKEMQARFGIAFIMCSKLNQDALEALFALLRARTRTNDHPTPLVALRSLRVIMLGKNITTISLGQNTKDRCDEDFVILEMLRKMKTTTKSQDSDKSEDTAMALQLQFDEDQNDAVDDDDEVFREDPEDFVTERDGFEYLVGAMCRKYKAEFPYLGDYTYHTPGIESLLDHDYAFPQSYVQHLSLGGLTKPSEKWFNQARKLEACFKAFHKQSISSRKNVCSAISRVLRFKYPDVPPVLVDHFVRHRTFIRINTLNRNLKIAQMKKNSVKRLAKPISTPLTAKQKKMKKILK